MSVRAKRRRIGADAQGEAESRVEGRQRARSFCLAHAEALIDLIATYADDEAETALATLREAFWGAPHDSAWEPDHVMREALQLDAARKGETR